MHRTIHNNLTIIDSHRPICRGNKAVDARSQLVAIGVSTRAFVCIAALLQGYQSI